MEFVLAFLLVNLIYLKIQYSKKALLQDFLEILWTASETFQIVMQGHIISFEPFQKHVWPLPIRNLQSLFLHFNKLTDSPAHTNIIIRS